MKGVSMAWRRVHEQMLSWHPDIKMQFSAPKNPPVSLKNKAQEGQRSIYSFSHSRERIVK